MDEKKTIKINLKTFLFIAIIITLTTIIILAGFLSESKKLASENSENIGEYNNIKEETKLEELNDEYLIVPTMNDKISKNSSWCGTIQLIWNDMKKEFPKTEFDEYESKLDIVKNLNKEDFTQEMLSDEYYYKTHGKRTIELKEKIEKEIKEKFNQTSDILNQFDWSKEDSLDDNLIFYTMLYKKFEFLNKFNTLENGKFGNKYDNIEYFGIDDKTENVVRDQIDVLYYNSEDDFAVVVNTKSNDEVIFCKNPKGNTFNEIYENMKDQENKYTGNKSVNENDQFKAPKIDFDEEKHFDELKGIILLDKERREFEIDEAIQTIKFSLDEKGGEIKSEAAVTMKTSLVSDKENEEPRYFYLDDTFAVFLREKGKERPYFATRIDDITKFQ